MAELAQEAAKPVEWIIDGLVPVAGVVMLAGLPQVGKSRLMYAAAAARSVPQNGHGPSFPFTVRPGHTFVCALEHNIQTHLHQLDEAAKAEGLTIEQLDATMLRPHFEILRQSNFDVLAQACDKVKADMLVLDSLRALGSFDENSSKETQAVMQRVNELAERRVVVVMHHLSKGSGQPRGSNALTAASDTILSMQPTALGVALKATHHDAPEVEALVRWDANGRMVKADAATVVADAVMAYLKRRAEPLTSAQLRDHLYELKIAVDTTELARILYAMKTASQLTETGDGKRRQWSLAA
jgi:hypothetical protein